MSSPRHDHASPETDVQEAASRVCDEGALLLDVREDEEWRAGHAPGAVHVPLGQLGAHASALDPGRPVLAVCRSGNRSRTAAEQLSAAGLDVVDVRGGMQAWQRAGLPTITDDGSLGTVA